MHRRIHALLFIVLAVVLTGLAACGGDDSTAEKKTRDGASPSPSPSAAAAGATREAATSGAAPSSSPAGTALARSGRTLDVDCGRDIKALRFVGKLAVQGNVASSSGGDGGFGSLFGSLLSDITFSGAYQAPDRTQLKAEIGGQNSFLGGPIEFVQIGDTSYTRLGNTPWQQSTGDAGPADQFDPRTFCNDTVQNLPGDVQGRKEKVNGVDATRYEYDRKALEAAGNSLGDLAGSAGPLPDNTRLSVWVSEKEKFPVKMTLVGSGTQSGQTSSINLEFNVTDINAPNVKIEAPR